MTILLLFAVAFLAYSNGANDNFKGVASLFGSRTCGFRMAISWATITTFAGSITALFLAETLLKKFSGKGLVPDALLASPAFVLAVVSGAGATVILATLLGFPISTTHGLTGALVGAGLVASGSQVNLALLGKSFVLPLLLSPLLAVVTGALTYLTLRFVRRRLGVTKATCVCVGMESIAPLDQPGEVVANRLVLTPSVSVGNSSECNERYSGRLLGMNAARLVDALHFLSAGAVGFARGLNDTPKIAALLLVASAFDIRLGVVLVALAMAIGGLLNSKKVAETMSHKLTQMNSGQGFAANLSTALLVTSASVHGLPVSTTHVSVGSLLGMGTVTGQIRWKPVLGVLASWVVTLPCAASLSALGYLVFKRLT
jgi:PiT family inorganic phosphate transporter